MGTDAFVLRYKAEGLPFLWFFLASPDFDNASIKGICRSLGLHTSGTKNEMIDRIENANPPRQILSRFVLQALIQRNKRWLTWRVGRLFKPPACGDASDLLYSIGSEQWYGPVADLRDETVSWYIRPAITNHWEVYDDSHGQPVQGTLRWLAFARISDGIVSFHWRGFTYGPDNVRRIQFPHWLYVAKFVAQLEGLARSRLAWPRLHRLVLFSIWDRYRYDPDFRWVNHRIRAEANGVVLSAHAGAVRELDVGGINALARAMRRAVDEELKALAHSPLPDPERFDEVILRAIIRKFGAVSFEFSLEKDKKLFWGHSYFGIKPDSHTIDAFPQVCLHPAYGDDLVQMDFLLRHMEAEDVESSQPLQPGLF